MVRKFSFSPLGSEISKKVILSSDHETDSSKKSSLLISAFLKRELCCGEQISSPASLTVENISYGKVKQKNRRILGPEVTLIIIQSKLFIL